MSDELLAGITDLTDRERLLMQATAKLAADMAVKQMQDTFYKGVGMFTINKLLIVLGALVVGLVVGKGWVKF